MAFSKVPSTFFGSGYSVETPALYAETEPVTNTIVALGTFTTPNSFVKDGQPVYVQVSSGTFYETAIVENTIYYARDVTYTGTYPSSCYLSFKLALTSGGAAINFVSSPTKVIVKRPPFIGFTISGSELSPAVAGVASVVLLPALLPSEANLATGDYRYILQALYADLQTLFAALPTANKPTAVRMDTEQYQQGLSGVVTQALRTEFDFNASLTTLTTEP